MLLNFQAQAYISVIISTTAILANSCHCLAIIKHPNANYWSRNGNEA